MNSWKTPAAALVILALASITSAHAADPPAVRGKYLVTLGGCMDCHTPGYFFGKPDMARFLGGSEVGFEIPDLGVFYGPNLTPDKETGLGNWTDAQVATAMTTGIRPDGRMLAPIMPWHALANLTKEDVGAIVSFLRSLPPVKNKVPGPFGPKEAATSFVMKIVPPAPQGAKTEAGDWLAERWCKGCHNTSRNPTTETSGGAPSFKSIAVKPTSTVEALDQHLSTGHTRMPDFALGAYERSLLIAYILSLR